MERQVVVVKVIINQAGNSLYTIGANQLINISRVEVDGNPLHSVGIQGISFGLFRHEKRAVAEFDKILDFIHDESRPIYRVEFDK